MDPAPRQFDDLPRDPELGVPVPFACGTEGASARRLDGRRVTQCALSRVCGVCGSTLGRPIAFLGTTEEAERNAFHFPPSHLECARALLASYDAVTAPVLGQEEPVDDWVVRTTAAFDFLRPGREDADRRAAFQPGAVLSESRGI